MVPIEAKGFGLAHERLVRELCTHLDNFLLVKNGVIRILAVLSTNHSASRLEFIMEAMCACWKAFEVARVVEDCAKNVIARVIGRPLENPVAFRTVHLV
jgi:hypothetical protein